jgi:hypothetical protein
MADLITESFNRAERAAHTVTSFTSFKKQAANYPHGLIRVHTVVGKRLFRGLTVANELTLYRDNSRIDEVAYLKETYPVDTKKSHDALVSSAMLSGIHRIRALQMQPTHVSETEHQQIEYETPEGIVYDLRRPKHQQDLRALERESKEQGGVVFPVVSSKAGE